MEYNALDNNVNGKPKGKNFFMGKDKLEKDTTVKLTEEMMKQDFNLDNDLVIQREKREIKEYNENLRNVPEEVTNLFLNGNNVLVRLFKHNPHIDTGLVKQKKPIKVRYQDPQSGKYKEEDAFLQYLHRGVIVNNSGKTSDWFKENFKVGDVVDLRSGISLEQQICFLDIQKFYHEGLYAFDNYFLINENMIEKKFIDYKF